EARLRDAEALATRLRQEGEEARASCRDLTSRLADAEARAESARVADELTAVRAERDTLATEQGENTRQAEQLRARVAELEKAQADAETARAALAEKSAAIRARGETKRRALLAQWEGRQRALALEADERLTAQRARA